MIKITFSTISVGTQYQDIFYALVDKISQYSDGINFLCVVDKAPEKMHDKCSYKYIDNNETIFIRHGHKLEFNFNLKYIPLQYASEYDSDYIVFIDSDWHLHKDFHIDKVWQFFETINKTDYDLIYERPHTIGGCKTNKDIFWRHKAKLYDLYNISQYDNAHVVNEQFLVFRNTYKLQKFVDAWRKRNIICLENNVRPWAEGVEIGMSYLDAGMKPFSGYHNLLHRCFTFRSKGGQEYIRW